MNYNRLAAFKRALVQQGDLWDFEDIVQMCKDGEMQSFADKDDNWVVTRICVFPKRRALEIVAIVGDYEGIRRIEEEQVIPFATEQGVELMMASGRLGFLRNHPENWRLVSATYMRTL